MKAKLLKKLRANYVINKRNNEYQLLSLNGKFSDDGWTSRESALKRRREHILHEARIYYKEPKSRLILS